MDWRYYYRRYLGLLPVQFCFVCGRAYWGGLPRLGFERWRVFWQWQPWWSDYCSQACADEELEGLAADSTCVRPK